MESLHSNETLTKTPCKGEKERINFIKLSPDFACMSYPTPYITMTIKDVGATCTLMLPKALKSFRFYGASLKVGKRHSNPPC